MKKIQVKTCVKVNAYAVVSRAVEEGVAYGYGRAYKHTDKPSKDLMMDEMEKAVMLALCEVLLFGDEA